MLLKAWALWSYIFSPKRSVNIFVSHMNRISLSLLEHNPKAIQTFLMEKGKASFVLPNGCIIIGICRNGRIWFTMLFNAPSDTKRFITSAEFNTLKLSAPIPRRCRRQDVHIFMRHGQAIHNLTPEELQVLWDALPYEQKEDYARRAADYINKRSWVQWDMRTKEDQQRLIFKIMRTDAPLTEKGRNEALEASRILAKFLEENYPSYDVTFYTSELLRAYETASVVLAEWKKHQFSFSYDHVVHAGFRELNEMHREIGSAFHMLKTKGRLVAETLGLKWQDYAPHILKNPLTEEELAVLLTNDDSNKMWELKERVEHVVNENTPMPEEMRPTTLHGVDVKHCEKPREEYPNGCDLFSVLSIVRGG
jgi:broad specificity phosphatase PhoE